jgi:hypothetical protein
MTYIILYREIPKDSTKKTYTNCYNQKESKVATYKINIQKSILYTNDEKEIKK